MNDFFLRLAARSLDSPPAALPRIASRFATPDWDRSPQVDTPFAASAEAEQPPAAPAAARPHHDRTMLAAAPPPTAMRHDRPATSSPRRSPFGSHIFAVDAENAARKTPIARASGEVPSDSHNVNAIESRREALPRGPERSAQFVPASLSGIRAADRVDPFPEAGGPSASTGHAGIAPASTSRSRNEAKDASSDLARVPPSSSEQAPAGLARATLDVSEPARSRPATPDRVGAMPDTPPAPEIHVSIGRIEVRAVIAPVAATPSPRRAATGPALSLEAYLRERQEGSR